VRRRFENANGVLSLIPASNWVAILIEVRHVAKRLECAAFRRFLSAPPLSYCKAPECGALQTLRDNLLRLCTFG